MRDKIVAFLLIACVFILNIEVLVISTKLDKAEEKLEIYEEDLNKFSSETDASIASLTDSAEELAKIQENLASNLDATDESLSSVTDAVLTLIENTTEEVTTEEPTTEQPTTEAKKTETTTKSTKQPVTTEQPTTEVKEAEKDESVEYHHDGNVWGITLTDSDINYLWRMAETETHGADMMSKTHVISVALNRCIKYGQSPTTVITTPNQFGYWQTGITDSTKEALDYVLANGDTARGALFFHSGGYSSTWQGRPCIFGDDVGHYFY